MGVYATLMLSTPPLGPQRRSTLRNIYEMAREETFCFLETWIPERGYTSSSVLGMRRNHYIRRQIPLKNRKINN